MTAKSYSSPTSIREFKEDLRLVKKLQSQAKFWISGESEVNVRAWLNMLVICYNQFGPQTSSIVMYDMNDSEKVLISQLISFLGREDCQIDQEQKDERLEQELQKI